MSKEERRAIAADKYAERMAKRAAETPGNGPKLAAQLAEAGWTPDRIAAETDLDPNDLRHWFGGAPLPRDAERTLKALLTQS